MRCSTQITTVATALSAGTRWAGARAAFIAEQCGADEELRLPLIPSSLIGNNEALSTKFKERVKIAKEWLETKLGGRNGIVVFDVTQPGNLRRVLDGDGAVGTLVR